jgi:hypothetical protein
MNNNIQIDKRGVIIAGEKYEGWYIRIEPAGKEEQENPPYLILYVNPNKDEGYDDWVENRESLEDFMAIYGFQIEWEE